MKIGLVSNSDFFIPLAHSLAANGLQVSVFFSPGEDAFQNSKAEIFCNSLKLSLVKEKDYKNDIYDWLKKKEITLLFVCGYKHLINTARLSTLKIKAYNIHPGPLPAFRGPVPVFWQLRSGLQELGVCIHELSAKFDDGPVIWSKKIKREAHFNYSLVHQLFAQVCVEGAFYIIKLLLHSITPPPAPSEADGQRGYQKKPQLEDVMINWATMGASAICDLISACNPWNKGATTLMNGAELKLLDGVVISDVTGAKDRPGMIERINSQLVINTIDRQVAVNSIFYNDAFIAAYQLNKIGFSQGIILG